MASPGDSLEQAEAKRAAWLASRPQIEVYCGSTYHSPKKLIRRPLGQLWRSEVETVDGVDLPSLWSFEPSDLAHFTQTYVGLKGDKADASGRLIEGHLFVGPSRLRYMNPSMPPYFMNDLEGIAEVSHIRLRLHCRKCEEVIGKRSPWLPADVRLFTLTSRLLAVDAAAEGLWNAGHRRVELGELADAAARFVSSE